MLIDQVYREATDFIEKINSMGKIPMSLGELKLTKPIANPENADLRKIELRDSSGLYFIVRPSGNVTYIGKATKKNLHRELWGKLRTPLGESNACKYPNTYWSKMKLGDAVTQELLEGKMRIAAFTLSPASSCSLLEVYLQTLCYATDGALPCMNSQIG